MKKLLSILVLSLLFSGSANAEIFKCKFNENHTVVIKTDRLNKQQSLVTVDLEKGVFNNDSIIATTGIYTGELIEFKGNKTREYDLVVLHNAKKDSDWSFRAIYFEEVPPYITTIKIDYWDKNHPIFMYDDWNNEIVRGACD